MAEQEIGVEPENKRDLRRLEVVLQHLWEKARLVSDALLRAKEEIQQLKAQVANLELAKAKAEADVELREQEIEQLKNAMTNLQSAGTGIFNREEKEALQVRIRDLIDKLNGRL